MFKRLEKMFPRKGSVLVFSIIILSVMLVSALSIATVSVMDRQNSFNTEKSSRSFQVADSGVEVILHEIYSGHFNTLNGLASDLGTTCNADGQIEASTDTGKYAISFYDDFGEKFTSDDCSATDWRDRIAKIKSEGVSGTTTRAVEVAVAATAMEFGGIYQTYYSDSDCLTENPFTADCTCPTGYTASMFNEFKDGDSDYYDGKGMKQYFCYEKN
jgi:hypothetical protein